MGLSVQSHRVPFRVAAKVVQRCSLLADPTMLRLTFRFFFPPPQPNFVLPSHLSIQATQQLPPPQKLLMTLCAHEQLAENCVHPAEPRVLRGSDLPSIHSTVHSSRCPLLVRYGKRAYRALGVLQRLELERER